MSVRGVASASTEQSRSSRGATVGWLAGLGRLQETDRKEREGQGARLRALTKSLTGFYSKHNPDYIDRVDGLARSFLESGRPESELNSALFVEYGFDLSDVSGQHAPPELLASKVPARARMMSAVLGGC